MIHFIRESYQLSKAIFWLKARTYMITFFVMCGVLLTLHFTAYQGGDVLQQKTYMGMILTQRTMNPLFSWLTSSLPGIEGVFLYRALVLRNPWKRHQVIRSFLYSLFFSLVLASGLSFLSLMILHLTRPFVAFVPFIAHAAVIFITLWMWLYFFVAYVLIASNYGLRLRESFRVINALHLHMLAYVILVSLGSGLVSFILIDGVHQLLREFFDILGTPVFAGAFFFIEYIVRVSLTCVFMVGGYRCLLNYAETKKL
ncbi:MAG: hypothetical protein H6849_04770 [Alphaproteobacteria bacterium]|nr:MAG: hypothetical protein H6849_04770 [Alphaproteobacteria bacterium]